MHSAAIASRVNANGRLLDGRNDFFMFTQVHRAKHFKRVCKGVKPFPALFSRVAYINTDIDAPF